MRKSILAGLSFALLASCRGGTMPPAMSDMASRSLRSGAVDPSRWRIAYARGITYQGVALGPDGNIWMCDGGFGTTLDRFSSGEVKKYELGYEPEELTVGADHNLWVTTNESTILRVTTAGKVTDYPVSDVLVGGIILGRDHNVWFVEQRYIGQITPSGALKEYPLIVGSMHLTITGLSGIAWGPDNHLWFGAEGRAPYVVNLDPVTGLIRIVGPGSISIGPVVTGPDGNIWYTEGFARHSYRTLLVRLSMTGFATTYRGPPKFIQAATPKGMVVGPHGVLWFVTQHIGGSPPHVIGGGIVSYNIRKKRFSVSASPRGYTWEWDLAFDSSRNVWMSGGDQAQVFAAHGADTAP